MSVIGKGHALGLARIETAVQWKDVEDLLDAVRHVIVARVEPGQEGEAVDADVGGMGGLVPRRHARRASDLLLLLVTFGRRKVVVVAGHDVVEVDSEVERRTRLRKVDTSLTLSLEVN